MAADRHNIFLIRRRSRQISRRLRDSRVRLFVVLLLAFISAGCGQRQSDSTPPISTGGHKIPPDYNPNRIPLPEADQRLGSAVVILVDTSGSMDQHIADADGNSQPKHAIAREVLQGIVDHTDKWTVENTDHNLEFGILTFSSSVQKILDPRKFDRDTAENAIAAIPRPTGGTAIGEALRSGYQALYANGCLRKYIICVTDGENTSGADPEWMARQLFQQTGGEVEIHFVAFDTSARHFGFVNDVNGFVVEAADGEQLKQQLTDIYDKRIFAEAMPAEAE